MEFNRIEDFEMNYAGVFFGRIGDLKVFKEELNRLAAELSITIRYEDFQRGKLWIKREGSQ
ncbi:MAG: hypothetical protein K8R68_09550 [Bacteroidales bacterium]|nr:hypothetical protein [Bacteroidales bacterium]